MNTSDDTVSRMVPAITNGSGTAALLAAGVGSFAMATLACAADKSPAVKSSLIFYIPTGPLSGVTTLAILIWLVTWGFLEWRWRSRTVAAGRIAVVALALLGLSVLLTFPPIVELL